MVPGPHIPLWHGALSVFLFSHSPPPKPSLSCSIGTVPHPVTEIHVVVFKLHCPDVSFCPAVASFKFRVLM